MAAPPLAAEGLVVERSGTRVLDGVSVEVPARTATLVRGASGAGKSTLFEMLALLDRPDSGTVAVAGEPAADLPERERARLRRDAVGVVFQEFELVADLTAVENAALPQEHAGDRDEAWLGELFDLLDIADLADAYPPTLSGGEKQRVAIARALANRPDVVLADEPTGQLDPATSRTVRELLLDSRAFADAALVVISHQTGIADAFDRVFTLADGTLARGE